jgi:hypothetical protein
LAIFISLRWLPTQANLPSNLTQERNLQDTVYRIIPAPGKTFGYEILVKDKVLIRQANIPGIAGTLGFLKKKDAEQVAMLMITKMHKGMMPPTVTIREMDSLHVKY